jgi:hypothetical protein
MKAYNMRFKRIEFKMTEIEASESLRASARSFI